MPPARSRRGLSATSLARLVTPPLHGPIPETLFAKGHYIRAERAPRPSPASSIPCYLGRRLGIHFTLTTSGEAKFGPDVDWCNEPSPHFDESGGATASKAFAQAIRRYWPSLDDRRLTPAYAGIRPKLAPPGAPPQDFRHPRRRNARLRKLDRLYGIESPGLTASLAIGRFVAGRLAAA